MISKIFYSVFFITLSFSILAQTPNETNSLVDSNAYSIENSLFDSHLDSLLELTYIKKMWVGRKISASKTVNFSDSVLSKKIKEIDTYVELSYNEQVKSFIEFYANPKNRQKVESLLGLANYYSENFEEILKKNKLPLALQYVAVSGSGLFPAAVSHTGSSGIWQLSYPVAKRYDLNITSYTDERRDMEKATKAAVKYLKEMYSIYHDWNLAIGAYFCGAASINKAISRANGERNYWKIYKFLPKYTREHLPAFIATIYISEYYKDFGIVPLKVKINKQIASLEVKEKVHFGQISEYLNIPIQELKDLNPEYKRGIIQPINDNNVLKLSAKNEAAFVENEDSIYAYKATTFFQAPQTVVIAPTVISSSKSSTAYYEEATVPKNKAQMKYTVKSGDNLGLIAQWYNVSINEIKSWNSLFAKKTIYPGQVLDIYVPKYETSKYNEVNTMSYAQKQALAGKSTTTSTASTTKTASASNSSTILSSGFALTNDVKNVSSYVYYKVKKGDNLWDISRKFEGTSVEKIKKLNNLGANYKLNVGQILKIKEK